MKKWQVIGAVTLVVLLVAVWRILSYEQERNQPAVVNKPASRQLTEDQMVVPKKMFIDSLKSAKELNGKSVWMKTGYTLPYYAYRTGRVVFLHEEGRLPPAQELQVK